MLVTAMIVIFIGGIILFKAFQEDSNRTIKKYTPYAGVNHRTDEPFDTQNLNLQNQINLQNQMDIQRQLDLQNQIDLQNQMNFQNQTEQHRLINTGIEFGGFNPDPNLNPSMMNQQFMNNGMF